MLIDDLIGSSWSEVRFSVPVKQREGMVVSDKMNKTIVVAVENRVNHPKYGKVLVRTKRYQVHDEKNACQVGDRVRIHETRPLSKTKRWIVDQVLKNKGQASPMIEVTPVEENLRISSNVDAFFPKQVSIGETYTLKVDLSLNLPDSNLIDRIGAKTIRIGAFLSISELDFDSDKKMRVVELSPKLKSSLQVFNIVPKREGERVIGVDFFQGSRYLGSKEVQTKVIKAKSSAAIN